MTTINSLLVGTLLTGVLVGLTLKFGILGFACGMFLFLIASIGAK